MHEFQLAVKLLLLYVCVWMPDLRQNTTPCKIKSNAQRSQSSGISFLESQANEEQHDEFSSQITGSALARSHMDIQDGTFEVESSKIPRVTKKLGLIRHHHPSVTLARLSVIIQWKWSIRIWQNFSLHFFLEQLQILEKKNCL